MEKLFDSTPSRQFTIAEQEAAYKLHYESWYNNYMVERFVVGKDPKNCEPCYFLNNKHSFVPLRCMRLDQPIYQIDTCLTGPMIQKPKTIDEIMKIGNTLLVENREKK
mgnify:FL=1